MPNKLRRAAHDRLLRAVGKVTARHRDELERLIRAETDRAVERIGHALTEIEHLKADLQHAVATVQQIELRDRRNIFAASERHAVAESARFAREHMPTAPTFSDPVRTLEHALSLAPAGGMALEFGVYSGHTLGIIADARGGREVYGFDSFKGLPEDWRTFFPAGTFGVDTLPSVTGAELVVGWFDETLPGFLAEHPGPISFLHLDADLYSSTKTVLDLVGPRLRPSTVIQFDEYFNFPGWQQHEYRAWQEHVQRTGTTYTYEGYTIDNEQVIVRIAGAEA